jgi:hypothetical protein
MARSASEARSEQRERRRVGWLCQSGPRRSCWIVLAFGCSPAGDLVPFPLAEVEDHLAMPTGALERTDALGVAYAAFETDRFMTFAAVVADQIPGLRQSSRYAELDSSACTEKEDLFTRVDYRCLGHPDGELTVRALGRYPNDNGEYELELSGVDLGHGDRIDGTAHLLVEGIANPTAPERAILIPVARLGGFPRFFSLLERVAVEMSTENGDEGVEYLSSILNATFVAEVQEVTDSSLLYTVRDAGNLWTCRSERDEMRLMGSECRTPVGQGDFGVLRF